MASLSVDRQLELPPGTRAKLDAFRRRVWRVKLTEGLCAAVVGLVVSYLLVFLLDRLGETPRVVRSVILLVGTLGLGVFFPLKCHRWIWRTRKLEQLARLLKHRFPRLSDRMLGIIELAQSDTEQQRSAVLCAAALRQVDEDIADTTFEHAVPHPRHVAWAWAAGIPLLVVACGLLFVPSASLNALRRWVLPWQDTARYTFAQFAELPAQLVVPYAEPFAVSAPLSTETAWSPATARATLGEQPALVASRDENHYDFEVPPQQHPVALTLAAGDARSTIQVDPQPRPELTDLIAEVTLPDYLQYEHSVEQDARGGKLSVVEGSQARLRASTSRPLAAATLNGKRQSVQDNQVTTENSAIDASTTFELSWTDHFGLTAKSPFPLQIEAREDRSPTIICSELDQQQVVLVDQVLSFAVHADDDFGLRHIGIEWQGVEDPLLNPLPAHGELLLTQGAPESADLTAQATFCAAREGIEPQTLQIRLFTTDYHPDRGKVFSPPYTLFVLSAADHANWLTEQMRRWSRQAQEVFERENQLYETNKQLRALPPGELARPENRQRLETQAAAESTNARQLRAVSAQGKQLVLEAAKNEQFGPATMENLAQMIKQLDQMAQDRMPSVADLLKRAASAPQEKPASGKGDGQDGPTPPQVGHQRDNLTGGEDKQGEDEESPPKPNTPSISDVESSFNEAQPDTEEEDSPASPPAAGGGKFGLPSTTVLGGGKPQPKPEQEQEAQETAEEILDDAIEEQQALIDAFTKVAEELQRILDSLEGSTFVKRLKAASRRHLRLAEELNASLAQTFGRRPGQLTAERMALCREQADTQQLESQNLLAVRQDMEAYYNRVQEGKFRTVLTEMNELNAIAKLERLAELVRENLHGQSIAHAEYWADTLDRWAEQLVGPGKPDGGAASAESKGGSLSPAIVLDVMRILEKEMGLREETRSTEQMRAAIEKVAYRDRAIQLADTQQEILDLTVETMQAIVDLEKEKDASFPKERQLLTHVSGVMQEVDALLREPNTGSETLAAETEIIELLLQVQRQQPPKQKSQGTEGNKPNGGGEGDTEESALALLGRGDEANAGTTERAAAQATGTSGTTYPAEFRAGLDAYFADLEK